MSMIEQKCPHCGEIGEFSELYLGRERTCPNCGKKMQVGEIKKEAQAIPWRKVIPAAVSLLIILVVLGIQAKKYMPVRKDTSKAQLRCMRCDHVMQGSAKPEQLPAKCPNCGRMSVLYCIERCANPKCGKISFYGLSGPRRNCKYCGGEEFKPLEK